MGSKVRTANGTPSPLVFENLSLNKNYMARLGKVITSFKCFTRLRATRHTQQANGSFLMFDINKKTIQYALISIGILLGPSQLLAKPVLSIETEQLLMNEGFSGSEMQRLKNTLNDSLAINRNSACVYHRGELPIFKLAPGDFEIMASYHSKCTNGSHSINVNNRVSGRGWLVAYIFRLQNDEWVQVSGGSSAASFYGRAGEYRLVAMNKHETQESTGHAKVNYPLF